MSSRFPPPGRGDSRYLPRDRSPPRFPDRRTSGPHGGPTSSARSNNDFFYRANDTYAHSGPRREPPRGPKAFGAGPVRGFGPRGRGFRGRGDGLAREYRDPRDTSAGRREQDHREWTWRDRDPSRERRPSPMGRNRSRSPALRDYRDSRDHIPRDVEQDRSRRNSREGFTQPSPAVSDPPPSAGSGHRGSFFGRGRPDREFGGRSRGSFGEEQETCRARSRSRERPWERGAVDDRDRDRLLNSTRRDEYPKKEWDDRDRDSGRAARDSYISRPESGEGACGRSVSTSPPPQRHNLGRASYDFRNSNNDSIQRSSTTLADPSELQGAERPGAASIYHGRDLPPQRASSPPQAPQVPAFGSVVSQKPQTSQKPEAPAQGKDPSTLNPPSQPNPSMTNVPSAPKAQLLSGLPTGPRADHSSRRPIVDSASASSRWSDGRGANPFGSPHTSTPEAPFAPTFNGERYNGPKQDSRVGQQSQQAVASRLSLVALPNQVLEDTNRYNSNSSNLNAGQPSRSLFQDPPTQSPPISIPTGPRAERSVPTAKPSILSPGRGRPNMMQRGPRGTNLRWVRPGLSTHTPRGPSIMSPMTTKKDYAEEDPTGSLDGDLEEDDGISAPPSGRSIKSFSPETTGPRQRNPEQSRPDTVEDQTSAVVPQSQDISKPSKPGLPSREPGETEVNDVVMEDEQMDLDEEYLVDERKFQLDIRLLESRRPATPRHNSQLLSLLDEIDALASAADDRARGVSALQLKPEHIDEPNLNVYPSPRVVEDDPFQGNTILASQGIVQILTPPIDSLPFLMSGPPTPLSEVGDLLDQPDLQESVDAQLMNELTSRLRLENIDHEEVKEQYYQDYKAWRMAIEDWEDRRAAATSVPVTPAPVQTPILSSAPISEGRRSARNVSELDFERALRDSVVLASEEQQRREQEAKSSVNPEKEAIIPDMLNEHEVRIQNLVDTTNLVNSSDAYSVFGYFPKPSDFTAEEQEIFTEAFLASPKKFGEIAKALPGRTYQECIRHYYLTKHQQQYKEKLANRLKKGRRGPARSTGRPKGSAPSLLSNAMVDERNQIEVTDTGRPRRAAAPTFGDSLDPEASAPSITPSRRNISGSKADVHEAHPEKPPARRGRGGATKERVPRKPKAQLLAAAPGPSPQKPEKETTRGKSKEPKVENEQQLDDIRAGELLTNLQHDQGIPAFTQHPPNDIWTESQARSVSSLSHIPKPPFTTQENLQPQQRAGSTSSYWSVPEQTDFHNLLHHFGSNWQAIADHMKTKTPTMVYISPFYQPHLSSLATRITSQPC